MLVPAAVIVTCVDALRLCGVTVAEAGDVPAGVASTYAACTVTVPAAFALRVPLLTVPIDVLDNVHCVPAVTSWVVPSLKCATAFRTAAPPTLILAGVAVTVRESRFCDEGLLHPVIKIETKKPHRSPEQTRALGEIRMNRLVSWKIQSIAAWGKWPFQRRERAFASLRYAGRRRIFRVLLLLLSRLSQIGAITPTGHYVSF